jgi:hypothetical protein
VTTFGGLACGSVAVGITGFAGTASAVTDFLDVATGGVDPGWNVVLDAPTVAEPGVTAGVRSLVRVPRAISDAAEVGRVGASFWTDALAFGGGLLDWNG